MGEPHQPGARPWLRLLDDGTEPRVLRAEPPGLVVWSSLWPDRPDAVLVLDVRPAGTETSLRWTLTTAADPPDEILTGHLRHRVDELLRPISGSPTGTGRRVEVSTGG